MSRDSSTARLVIVAPPGNTVSSGVEAEEEAEKRSLKKTMLLGFLVLG